MSFLAGIGDLLKQYSAGGATAANSPAVEGFARRVNFSPSYWLWK
jgi:hypothetical protein